MKLIASARRKKEIKHFTVLRPFVFLIFFLWSCYATEANHLWQEGRLSLNPDRGGKQSERHLFSLRTVFPIKPPHGQVQILSSCCKITFQRGTCLTKTIVYLKSAPWLLCFDLKVGFVLNKNFRPCCQILLHQREPVVLIFFLLEMMH